MSVPLSGQFGGTELTTGMFGGPRGRIRPRGSYSFAGVGDPLMGYNGYGAFWTQYPGIISGQTGYGGMSMQTGVPVGTTEPDASTSVVGGGAATAIDSSVPTEGQSQGGTAAS